MRGQNPPLKCYQPLEPMLYFGKGFRSFHTGNIKSVDQRAAKLLDVKVVVLKKKMSAASAITAKVCTSACGPG